MASTTGIHTTKATGSKAALPHGLAFMKGYGLAWTQGQKKTEPTGLPISQPLNGNPEGTKGECLECTTSKETLLIAQKEIKYMSFAY